MDFEDLLARVRALTGHTVTATLRTPEGRELARWEGEFAEETLDAEGVADRLEPRVAGHEDAEQRVQALRDGQVAMFTVGGKPLLIDRIDIAAAEPIEPAGVRIRDAQDMTIELLPA